MTVNSESESLVLKLWLLLHRVHDLLGTCENEVFGEYGLTTERFGVLVTIKYLEYLDGHVRPTDIAWWMGRSANSVSMIVDRMAKAGLLRRVRDKGDRRVVHVFITSKGKDVLKPATPAGLELIHKILSQLSDDDRRTLASLLEKLKYESLEYLNPGADIEGMVKNEDEQHANLLGLVCQ
jgi:MarR family 2-MHQ and catechol resistance regulon transcriptional repressor